jgi:PST family polysaccharide transporter
MKRHGEQLDRAARLEHMLDADRLRANLRERSIRGGMISVVAQAAKLGLHLAMMAVLARLLTPSDFGLVAMVTAVTAILLIFKDSGLSTATVQAPTLNERQASTLFWINIGLSVVLAGVAAGLSTTFARVFDEPRVALVMAAFAGGLILTGLGAQHQALLRRAMRFRTLAVIDLTSVVVGGAAGVTAALLGWGYWALVVLELSKGLCSATIAWCAAGWTPGRPGRCDLRGLIRVGGGLTGANLLLSLGGQGGLMMMSWSWSAATLGLYTRAHALLTLPTRQLSGPLSGVAIPTLSRLVDEPVRYRRATETMFQMIGLISAAAAAWMIVGRDWIVMLMLGPQWTSTAAIFGLLGFGAFVQPLFNLCGWVLVSQGRMRNVLIINIVDACLRLLAVAIGLAWGPLGVAAAMSIRYAVELPFMLWQTGRSGLADLATIRRALRLPLLTFGGLLVALQALRSAAGLESMAVGLLATGALTGVVLAGVILSRARSRRIARQVAGALIGRLRGRAETDAASEAMQPLAPSLQRTAA